MVAPGSRRVGLLVGRENTFPSRLLDAVDERGREHGVTAELAILGGAADLEEPAYGVIVDRISHEVPYYRADLKSAVLIDFGKQAEVPMRELALELLESVDDVVDDLGSRSAVEHVHVILREGASADRQRRAHAETASLAGVVDHLCQETAVR